MLKMVINKGISNQNFRILKGRDTMKLSQLLEDYQVIQDRGVMYQDQGVRQKMEVIPIVG
jgi:hypothetical protein